MEIAVSKKGFVKLSEESYVIKLSINYMSVVRSLAFVGDPAISLPSVELIGKKVKGLCVCM